MVLERMETGRSRSLITFQIPVGFVSEAATNCLNARLSAARDCDVSLAPASGRTHLRPAGDRCACVGESLPSPLPCCRPQGTPSKSLLTIASSAAPSPEKYLTLRSHCVQLR